MDSISSSSPSSSDHRRYSNSNASVDPPSGKPSDVTHSWWESIAAARSRIQLLSSLLPSSSEVEDPLSSISETDSPARSLLLSESAYSAALSSPQSGSVDDQLCNWLYDTYLASDADLRAVVLAYIPVISSIYLHRVHHPPADGQASLSGFEAVLLLIYSCECKARNGKPVIVHIPDLSQPSLYHTPGKSNVNYCTSLFGVLSPPLEPQIGMKSTKRAAIVGVALECYYKKISQMPNCSKFDFCKFATVWAGQDCPCILSQSHENNGFNNDDEIENVVKSVKDMDIRDERIPLPWEFLQPVLRILGHCLMGPMIDGQGQVKDAASTAVRHMHARALHDLDPQAILATRSLFQLDTRAREATNGATVTSGSSVSNASTPSKGKKSEVLMVSY